MGTTIHQLRGIITSDIKGFVQGMDQAGNVTRKLATQWNDARAAIWSASQRILAGITVMSVGITKVFADFEDAMIEVGAITRTLGTRDFDALTNAAKLMGETTRYSATEAAGGLKQLALSGLDTRQSIEALKPTLELATSAGVSIGQAASVSAKLMKAMGIEAKTLSHVNDVLVSTFQRSNTDLVMLSEGMKHAAPVAHALGVSLEDVTAILAKLSDAGFQGEMGGTALRNIMSRLAGAMPRMTKQFDELGIATVDSAGNMRPLLDILEDIEAKGLSTGKIMELFGQRGGPQLAALLQQGISSIRNFSYETSQATGQAAAVMEARTQTIKGQWDELLSYLEGLFLSAGERISPQVRKLINDVESFLRANEPQILKQMTQAAMGLVNGLQSLREWVVENRGRMHALVETYGGFLRWIADFMAAHPGLMEAFLALKVTGILGIYDAAVKTVSAIAQTIAALVAMSTKATETATTSAAAETEKATAQAASTAATEALTVATVGLTTAITSMQAVTIVIVNSFNGMASAETAVAGTTTACATAFTGLSAAVAASNTQLIVLGRTLMGVAALQQHLALSATSAGVAIGGETSAVTSLTLSQGVLSPTTAAATTALTVQAGAAGVASASLAGTTAATGALATGATIAAGAVTALRIALSLLTGPIGAVMAALAVGITVWTSKVDLFGDSIDEAVNKLRKLREEQKKAFDKQTERKLDEVDEMRDPADKRAALARIADEAKAAKEAAEDEKKKIPVRDGVIPDRVRELTRIIADQTRRGDEALARILKLNDELVNPKIVDASKKNKVATDELIIKYENLKFELGAGRKTAEEFNAAVNTLMQDLELTTRGFDPVVEQLFKFNRTLGEIQESGGNVADEWTEYNAILTDLDKVKHRLGDSFRTIADELNQLNAEFAAGVISQEEYRNGLARIRNQVMGPAREDRADEIRAGIARNKLDEEKSKHPEFETIQGLIGQDEETGDWDTRNLDANAMQAIGNSIEGASPEIVESLVNGFTALQLEGEEAVQEGMDDLILSFLNAVDEAKGVAEAQAELNSTASQANRRGGTQSTVAKYGAATGAGAGDPLYQAFVNNQSDAFNGNISQDLYRDRNSAIDNVASQANSVMKSIKDSTEQLDKGFKETGNNAKSFTDALKYLTKQFADGEITEDQFTERMVEMRKSMDLVVQAGNKVIEAEKKEAQAKQNLADTMAKIQAIASGQFPGGQVGLWQMIADKIHSIQMGQINQWVDQIVNQMLGLGNATQGLAGQFQQFGDQMDYYSTKAGDWFESKLGGASGGGSIQAGLDILFNSIQGQVANLTNTISMMAQALQFTNITMTRKLEIQRQIEDLIRQRDALLTQPPPQFVGTSYDAFFTDPGIRNGQNQTPQGPQNISMSFPNIDRITSAQISHVYDMMEQEAKRRGNRR